jgi:hypothetical protein
MVKHLFGTYGLKFLFFSLYTSIRITDGTCIMGKDGNSTFVQISVKKLTVVQVSTLKC